MAQFQQKRPFPSSRPQLSSDVKVIPVSKFDGKFIWLDDETVLYTTHGFLGSGASGVVYEAERLPLKLFNEEMGETPLLPIEEFPPSRLTALKILNPCGYRFANKATLRRASVARKGEPLSPEVLRGEEKLREAHVSWLFVPSSRTWVAAYENPLKKGDFTELTLPQCIDIWGWDPLNSPRGQKKEDIQTRHQQQQQQQHRSYQRKAPSSPPPCPPKFVAWLESRASVFREIANLTKLGSHPHVIRLFEVMELLQDSKSTLFLSMELVEGGELFDRISGLEPSPYQEQLAKHYFDQLLDGVAYCHQQGICHRDLKLENLLLEDCSEEALLKIADFGLSNIFSLTETAPNSDTAVLLASSSSSSSPSSSSPLPTSQPVPITPRHQQAFVEQDSVSKRDSFADDPSANMATSLGSESSSIDSLPSERSLSGGDTPSGPAIRRLSSVVGSPHYTAPEVLLASSSLTTAGSSGYAVSERPAGRQGRFSEMGEVSQGYDGRKVDAWSCGIILFAMLTGRLPFERDLLRCPSFAKFTAWVGSQPLLWRERWWEEQEDEEEDEGHEEEEEGGSYQPQEMAYSHDTVSRQSLDFYMGYGDMAFRDDHTSSLEESFGEHKPSPAFQTLQFPSWLFPSHLPLEAKCLLTALLHPNAALRMSVQEAREHPFMVESKEEGSSSSSSGPPMTQEEDEEYDDDEEESEEPYLVPFQG